jgi:phytoene dehydrogenase-like protein
MQQVVIIGGGLAGLFAANKYSCNPNNHVIVLESQKRIGGRIYTVRKPNGVQFEGGAGRIGSRESQPILWKLFDFFGIQPVPMEVPTTQHVDEAEIVRVLERHANPDRTVRQALLQEWPADKVDAVQATFGYDAEFDIFNSVVAKTYFNKHFRGPFYYLPEGLDVITTKLAERARSKHVRILTGRKVSHVFLDRVVCVEGEVFPSDKIVVCLDKASLEKIALPVDIRPVLQKISCVPLVRIFVQTANERAPREKRTGPGPVRMWIPMSSDGRRKATGVQANLFQVYCDSTWAVRWHDASQETQRSWLESFLGFADFEVIDREFWRNGVHLWNSVPPPFESFQTERVMFAGEMFSEGAQGWMEGAIETVRRL